MNEHKISTKQKKLSGFENTKIYGIGCSVESARLRRVIRLVLKQIRRRAPEDFKRIRSRVNEIAPLSDDSAAVGRFEGSGGDFETQGIVRISESDISSIATLAHEFGHACTRQEEYHRRMMDYDDKQLISELCATFYAYKWGFGRLVRRHPGIFEYPPGSTFEMGPSGDVRRYRVTRGFRIHEM